MSLPRLISGVISLLTLCLPLRADNHVVVVANADPAYIAARMDQKGKPRTETYVVMQGRFFKGSVRDASIERMDFRQIVDQLAPELAKKDFLPASIPDQADLLLVVHWGTTSPQAGIHEMLAQPTQALDHDRLLYEQIKSFNQGRSMEDAVGSGLPGAFMDLPAEYRPAFGQDGQAAAGFSQLEEIAHETSQNLRRSDNATLLGYNNALHRDSKRAWTSEDARAMRYDLNMERYFIIVRAYDLKKRIPRASARNPVWTMHVNISAPGNNFKRALARMGEGVARFAGQGTGSLDTIRAGRKKTETIKIGELIILGEVSSK